MDIENQDFLKRENEQVNNPENLYNWQELEMLPEGISITGGIKAVGKNIENIVYTDPDFVNRKFTPFSESDSSRLIGEILPSLVQGVRKTEPFEPLVGRKQQRMVDKLLDRYPNICWMRSGTLTKESGVATLDAKLGSDGLIGDAGVIGYADKDYSGKVREKPVLFLVPFSELIQGTLEGKLTLGSRHRYDISIHPGRVGKEEFIEWQKDNLKVYKLPEDAEDREKVKKILDSKTVK